MLGISVMAMAVAMDTGRFTIWLYWVLNTPCMEVTAALSTVFMFLFEQPTLPQLAGAAVAILYCGILSSGVGYTLQIVGQQNLDPTIASMAMCLESVFSALAGWLLLHQTLSATELLGCGLMFAAIVGAQLPDRKKAGPDRDPGA